MADEPMNWHHMFGVLLQDFFRGTPCEVELELDLSVKSQFLDVLIVRKSSRPLDRVLPDGLADHLVEHNLITFKSYRQTLNAWALLELSAHYVNYRKQVSPNFDDLLPEERFRLFAVCARLPEGLAKQTLMTEVQSGVFEVVWGVPIRIIVAGQLPRTEPNALLHLFSAAKDLLEYGQQHCRIWSPETSSLVARLFAGYRVEGLKMPYTREEVVREAKEFLRREAIQVMLEEMPIEKRLEGITPEQRLQGMTPEEREHLRRLLDAPPPS